jgi:hypothetical protein
MTKSFLMSALASALFALSCAGGETAGTGSGGASGSTGGSTGSGGQASGSGGAAVNSGGATGSGSGGARTGGSTGSGSGGTAAGSGGSTGAGTGGATGTATGGSTGAGTGGASVPTGAITVTAGYASNGTWKGYAYTFVGGTKATISPMTFTTETSVCATGTITADTTYASVAGVGFNVNQEMATSATPPPTATVATSGTGLAINVMATNLTLSSGGSQLRAQVKAAGGDYCANIAANGASVIPWAMFNKTCWDTTAAGAAAFTAGTAITAVELIIPSSGAATVGPFTACLLDAKSN